MRKLVKSFFFFFFPWQSHFVTQAGNSPASVSWELKL
jgi:hypothetical protein